MDDGLSLNEKLLEEHIINLQKKLEQNNIICKYEKKSFEYYIFLYIPSK